MTVTVVLAAPFVLLGLADVRATTLPLAALIFLFTVALSVRPIRLGAEARLSPSDVAVVAGILLLPPGLIALVAALARVTVDLVSRRRAVQVVRNAAAVALASGTAGAVYQLSSAAFSPVAAATIPAAVAAVLVLIALDVGQIGLLLGTLGRFQSAASARTFIWKTARAQLLWSLAAIIAIEIVRVEPLFLLPGVPLFLLAYVDIRARFAAERKARLLASLVEVGHAVGMSLDPVEIFRAVYHQVRSVMDADAFYVAILKPDGTTLSFRFLVDRSRELPATDRPMEGTLAGVCIERNQPILLRDAAREREKLVHLRARWGSVEERSLMVAPLRLRGRVIGAISAQSVAPEAYDDGDLELLGAVADEAAIAIDRADLYERTLALSRRLFDLHRIGLELAAHREMPALVRALADSVEHVIGASAAAVYLDQGGDSLEFAATTGKATTDVLTLSKKSAVLAPVVESGQAVELSDLAAAPSPETRRLMEKYGHRAVLVHPLRAANESVGVLFVTWSEPHVLNDDERELIGVLAGIGATAIRSIRLYRELDEAYLSTVSTLTAMIEVRDHYREDHQRRVAADAMALGERLGLGDEQLRDLRYASLFHSIGKIAIPAAILSKSGPLTREERRIVQEHPVLGARILDSIRFLRGVVPIVRHANERWDGSGYPDGLAGVGIPYAARMLNVVIGYEAMLADRPYRTALRPEAALAELRNLAGSWYDPAVVDEFARMIEARGTIAAAEDEVGATSRELAILNEITPEFHTLLDLQQLLNRILGILERSLPGSRLTILLKDEDTGDLVVRARVGAPIDPTVGMRIPPGRGISGWVMEHRQAVVVDDVRADPRYYGDPDVRSEIIAPLVSAGRVIGALAVSHTAVGAFGQRDLALMQAVGAQIAAAIDVAELHERLKRAANTDALTGIHNYGYFYQRLEEEVARAERRGSPLALAYFDIDDLKRVNDTHGHLAGDAVLRTLGEVIEAHVRAEDVPARYGGDEFAIVMPDTPRDEAEKVVQRLMDILDNAEVDLPDRSRIPMPARSWGVASYPLDGADARSLVENADTRAYARKRSRATA